MVNWFYSEPLSPKFLKKKTNCIIGDDRRRHGGDLRGVLCPVDRRHLAGRFPLQVSVFYDAARGAAGGRAVGRRGAIVSSEAGLLTGRRGFGGGRGL